MRSAERQGQVALGAPPPAGASAASSRPKMVLELLNIQSLLPKLADIRAELDQRDADVLCYTETNLKCGTPNRLVHLPGYRLLRRDRVVGRKNPVEVSLFSSEKATMRTSWPSTGASVNLQTLSPSGLR